MEFTYSFGYPNMQRTMAIADAINNSQTGESTKSIIAESIVLFP